MKPRFIRAVTAAPRLFAAAVTALALAAYVGVTAPAASAGITPACARSPIGLIGDWQTAGPTWNSGDPSYRVVNGIV